MSQRLTARGLQVQVDTISDTRTVRLSEGLTGTGWSLAIRSGLGPTSAANDDRYTLISGSTPTGISGGIRKLTLTENQLTIKLTVDAANRLAFASADLLVTLQLDTDEIDRLRDGLAQVFASVSTFRRPRRLKVPRSNPLVTGRPLLSPPHWLRRKRAILIENQILRRRGDLVDFAMVDYPDVSTPFVAAMLADQLGIDVDALEDRRFTCRALPDRRGIAFSDFRLIPEHTADTS